MSEAYLQQDVHDIATINVLLLFIMDTCCCSCESRMRLSSDEARHSSSLGMPDDTQQSNAVPIIGLEAVLGVMSLSLCLTISPVHNGKHGM